jgi:hypothetical protein
MISRWAAFGASEPLPLWAVFCTAR